MIAGTKLQDRCLFLEDFWGCLIAEVKPFAVEAIPGSCWAFLGSWEAGKLGEHSVLNSSIA